jgi:hypothetical protein
MMMTNALVALEVGPGARHGAAAAVQQTLKLAAVQLPQTQRCALPLDPQVEGECEV